MRLGMGRSNLIHHYKEIFMRGAFGGLFGFLVSIAVYSPSKDEEEEVKAGIFEKKILTEEEADL